jgi:HAD superfamily hydrolase (TIGR01662 family)
LEDFLLSTNGITTILFDLDGTLRHNRPSFNQAFCDYMCKLGAPDDVENRRKAIRWLHYYWAQSPEMLADREAYGEQMEAFWTNHARLGLVAFGCPPDQAETLSPQLYRLMAEDYQPENWVPDDVPEMLQALKDSGFTLGVVSNRTHSFIEELESLGIDRYFDCTFAAGEVNSWKPEPQIFLHALRHLGIEPHETLYVGDNYYADVLGAQRAGLRPVLLDPDGLFPEAACPVIHTIGGLRSVLEK